MTVRTNPRRARQVWSAAALSAVLSVAALGCGGSDGGDAGPAPGGSSVGGGAAARGEQIARSSGCAGCHGQNFQGAAGPTWVGLAGSEVTLADGTTMVADDAYLARAISEPDAEVVDGYSLKMPANDLSDTEVADIVAFIKSLDGG